MEYQIVASDACSISCLGFGCAPISGYDYGKVDEVAWVHAVQASFDSGINLFDVADVYGLGKAEELLSKALGQKRHDVVLASKFGLAWDVHGRIKRDSSPNQVGRALEESLRRLRVNCITIYQLHWPDSTTPLEDTLERLCYFRDEGKIRFIGVSNVPVAQLQSEILREYIDFVQIPYGLLCRDVEEGFLARCATTQTYVLAHSSLARGLLSGKRALGSTFGDSDTRNRSSYFSVEGSQEKHRLVEALREIGKHHGCSPSAVALRWVLDRREVGSVLVGIKNKVQLEDDLQVIGLRLESAERELLSSLSAACPGALSGALASKMAYK